MLVELGLVKQRYAAVREVVEDGATVTGVAGNGKVLTGQFGPGLVKCCSIGSVGRTGSCTF